MQLPIRIATRSSPLALAQTGLVADALRSRHELPPDAIEIVTITTSGDANRDRLLAEIGGKGLFTKEIEEALLTGTADLAVHSMKDVETRLPEGLVIAALLEREDPRDVLISTSGAGSIAELPAGTVVGTASLRRAAIVKALRSDIQVAPLRGNVGTRLRKLSDGEVGATLLAKAGLNRLGLEPPGAATVAVEEILPAVAQGAIGIEVRADDTSARDLVAPLDREPTRDTVTAERALLAELDGSCRTPIAALATIETGRLRLRGLIAKPDGREVHRTDERGDVADAARFGKAVGEALKKLAGPGFLPP